ncbi:MAG TPA: DUF3562 domain-containing protein [Steroidobacter sp.]
MLDIIKLDSVNAPPLDPQVVESIARETDVPIELVSRIYREELDALARKARITHFLDVIARRRVRVRLRQH